MSATEFVNAWAASQEREVLWLRELSADSVSHDQGRGITVLEGNVKLNQRRIGKKAEYHQDNNTLIVDGVAIPSSDVAIIGTKGELADLKQRAGGEGAATERILVLLKPHESPPARKEPDLAALAGKELELRKRDLRATFAKARGKAQMDAAIALCAVSDNEALAFLEAKLKGGDLADSRQRNDAVEALGAHGGPAAIGLLEEFLSDKPAALQRRAGMALGRNAGEAALEALRAALKSDDVDTAVGAACGLEMIGGKAGLELAASALTHADPEVRRTAVFGAWRAHGERALPLIEKALADPDAGVRRMAVNGLGSMATSRAVTVLRRQFPLENDPEVSTAILQVLEKLEKR